jgi:prevent-host-death family protein
MKMMTVFEARNHFARTLEAAKHDVVIVTRNGKPVAAIQAIDDDDIEDLLLERSERFWEMIARARRGKPVAIDTLRRRVQARRARGRPRGPRGRAARRRAT